jgi:hypothetical protein
LVILLGTVQIPVAEILHVLLVGVLLLEALVGLHVLPKLARRGWLPMGEVDPRIRLVDLH